jgi:subtilase family serine protease
MGRPKLKGASRGGSVGGRAQPAALREAFGRSCTGRVRSSRCCRPWLEPLEDRILLASALPDLAFASVTAPASAVVGQSFDLQWTVANRGARPAENGWQDRVYLSNDQVLDSADVNIASSYQENTLFPGGTYTLSSHTTIDTSQAAGSKFLLIVTDSSGNQPESDETNNVRAVPFEVKAPDLTLTDASAPATATMNQPFSVSYTVQNAGSVDALGYWSDLVYFSDDQSLDSSDRAVAYFAPGKQPLAAGASYTATPNITIPGTSAGNRYLLFVTDASQNQGETDETNNVRAVPISLTAPNVDLVVSDAGAPATAKVGQSIATSWTVANQGTDTTTANWADYVYLSRDTTLDSADTTLTGTIRPAPLAGNGATYTSSASLTIPNLAAGSYYLLFVTDPSNAQGETDDTNNVRPLAITVTGIDADLRVTAATVPGNVLAGQNVSIPYTVTNQGTESATASWSDNAYLSDDATFDPSSDKFLGSAYAGGRVPLAPQASYSLTLSCNMPSVVGDKYLLIVTDPSNGQSESDNTNNVWAAPITIQEPDLTVTAASAPATALLGSNITVSWTVKNSGTVAASNGWNYGIYYSDTPVFDPATAQQLDTYSEYQHAPLGPGATYTDTQRVYLESTGPGNRFLLFVTDAYKYLPETDETNNVYAVPITLTAPDMTITAAHAPASAILGSTVDLSWTVTNQGVTTSSHSWSDAVYVSTDAAFSPDDQRIDYEDSTAPLANGASYTQDVQVNLKNLHPGDQYLIFVTDSDDDVGETDETNNIVALPITLSAPDLVVSAASAPSTATVGDTIGVTWSVTNTSTLPANASWTDAFYLSANAVLDSSDRRLDAQSTGNKTPLAGGAVYSQSRNVPLPADTTPGSYYLLVVADDHNDQGETDETNNVYALPITLTAPDLAVASISAPGTVSLNQQIQVTWQVNNQSTTSAAFGHWNDAIYLSSDTALDSSDVRIGSRSAPSQSPVAAGGSYTLTQSVTIPTSSATGNRYLLVVADADHNQAESDETNNVYALAITVVAPDLVVTSISAPDTAVVNDTISVTWTVTNQGVGSAPANWSDSFYLSTDQTLSTSDLNLTSVLITNQTPLASGGSYTMTRNVSLPSVGPGDLYLLVVADRNNAQGESDETNNVSAVPIHLLAPDLTVSSASAPGSAVAGQSISVTWTVVNQSATVPAPGKWTDSVYLSDDQVLSSSDTSIFSISEASKSPLAPAGTYTVTQNVTLPSSAAPGTHYLLFKTDRNNEQGETDETNNVYAVAITILAPDLVVSAATAPDTAIDGDTIPVSWTVTNQGSVPAPAQWFDYVYLSSDQVLDPQTDRFLYSQASGTTPLPSNQSYTPSANVFLSSVAPGDYYLLFVADARSSQSETDETNNVLARPITLSAPDLVVTGANAPGSATVGQSLQLTWTIANQGSVPALTSWYDVVYLSRNATAYTSDHVLASVQSGSNSPLAAGANFSLTANVTIPSFGPGNYYLNFVTDAYGHQGETNESNNTFSVPITLLAPDLVVTAAHGPDHANLGETVNLDWTVTNQGSADALFTWYDTVSLSDDKVPSGDDTTLVTLPAPDHAPVAAGASYTLSTSAAIPNTKTGNRYLLFYTNSYYGHQPETNSSNNVLAVPIELVGDDLQVESVSTPASSAHFGDPIDVTWTVKNTGSDAALDGWSDRVWLSTDTALDPSVDKLLLTQPAATVPLAGGATYTQTATVTLPLDASLTDGSYFLIVQADGLGQQPETNEGNNFHSSPAVALTLNAVPDLVVQDITAPEQGVLGQAVPVSWTDANQGNGAATGPWVDKVYLSLDPTLGDDQLVGTFTYNDTIEAGKSTVRNEQVTLPAGSAGDRYLIVQTDTGDQVFEGTNEHNNVTVAGQPIHIQGADLVVDSVTAPAAAVFGDTIQVTWTVHNQGDAAAAAGWSDRIWLSNSSASRDGAVLLGTIDAGDAVPVQPGTQNGYTKTVSVRLPLDHSVAAGTYYVAIEADGPGNQIETNEDNNLGFSQALSLTLPPLPDLVVDSVTAPPAAAFGDTIRVTWTAHNQGDAAATTGWSDRIWLSTSSAGIANGVALDAIAAGNVVPLQPGTQNGYTKTASVRLPLNYTVTAGTYYVFVEADGLGNQLESNESNNLSSGQAITLSLPPLPDLVTGSIAAPASAYSGEKITVTWTDANQGNADIGGTAGYQGWTDYVYLASDASGSPAEKLGSYPFTGQLGQGQSVNRSQVVTLPIDTDGPRWLVVVADAENQVFEYQHEDNNSAVSTQPIATHLSPFPNLKVAGVTAPSSAFSGQETVTVEWTVTNTGTGPTSSPYWEDGVWLSVDMTVDSSDIFLGKAGNASYLNAGDSYASSLNVILPQRLSGDFHVLVMADYGNKVLELHHEDDNVTASALIDVKIPPLPDLQVDSVRGPTQAFSGQRVEVTWSVSNQGPGTTMEYDWTDAVYLSSDTTLDSSDYFLGTVDHHTLWGIYILQPQPDHSVQRVLTVTYDDYTDAYNAIQPIFATGYYELGIVAAGNLAPGQSYYRPAQAFVQLPVGVSGDFYFLVETDTKNQVYEAAFDANNTGASVLTPVHLTPPPDLVVANVSAPADAVAGHPLTITYRETNAGATAPPNSSWTDSFYLSPTPQFDASTALHLGDRTHQGSLAAGAAEDDSATFTLPDGLSGTFYAFVVADAPKAVFELDRTNNVGGNAATTSIAARPPDLVATLDSAPASAAAGTAIRVAWTVTNQGTGDTVATNWGDTLYLASDPLLSDAVALDSFPHDGLLGPGGSYAQSQLVILPLSVDGTYYLFVTTDTTGNVDEADRENNNRSQPATIAIVRQAADLQVTTVTADAGATEGGTLAVAWTVKNAGAARTATDDWYDDVYLTADPFIGHDSDVLLGHVFHNGALDPTGQYQVSKTFPLPPHVIGPYYVMVRTDSKYNVFEGAGENNNDGATTGVTTIVPGTWPDLAVTSISAPAEAFSGQTFDVSWTVQNNGTAIAGSSANPFAATWYDAVYLSRDQVFDPSSDIYLGEQQLKYLDQPFATGATYTLADKYTIPRGFTGPFYLFVVADAGNRIYEGGAEANNIAYVPDAISVVLAPPADLVAGTITVPANAVPGQDATITYTVQNASDHPAVGSWFDSLYLSSDDHWDVGDALFARVQHQGGVAAHDSYTATVTAPLPGVLPGDYRVIVRTDIRNNLPESNEDNNLSASIDQTAVDAPALNLGVAANGLVSQGQSLYYKVAVDAGQTLLVSLGCDDSSAVNELYVRYGAMPSRTQFDFGSPSAFAANQQIVVPETQAGTYYILAYNYHESYYAVHVHYSLSAESVPFSVRSVTPAKAGNAGPVTLVISGARFTGDTSFSLVDALGNLVTPTRAQVQDASTAYVTFDLTGRPTGAYRVQATPPNGQIAVLDNALTVVTGVGGHALASVSGPPAVSPSRQYVFQVSYGNDGDDDAVAPLLIASSDTNTPLGLGEHAPEAGQVFEVLGTSPDGPAGVLRPSQRFGIPFTFASSTRTIDFSLSVITGDDPTPLDPPALAARVRAAGLSDAQVAQVLPRLLATTGGTWGGYVRMLARNATRLPSAMGENQDPANLLLLELQDDLAANGSSIRGTISTTNVNLQLAGRQVVAHNADTGDAFAAVVMNDGSFSFANVTPGTYAFSVDGAIVTSGGSLSAAANQAVDGLALTVAGGAAIAGFVHLGGTNSAVPSTSVSAVGADGSSFPATINNDGTYVIAGLPPGTYTVVAAAPGMAQSSSAGVVIQSADATVNFDLDAEAIIRGSVQLQAGGPANGDLRVVARPAGDTTPGNVFIATVDSYGFAIKALPAGTYDVTVSEDGYVPVRLSVVVAQGQTVDTGSTTLIPAATIHGSVQSDDPASPAAFAFVSVSEGTTQVAGTQADYAGNFVIGALPPGTYTLSVGGDVHGFGDHPAVTLTVGQEQDGVVIHIVPGASILGTVSDAVTGNPLAGITVGLTTPQESVEVQVSGPDGTYHFDNLALGTYGIALEGGASASIAATVTDEDGAKYTADLQVSIAARLTGHLLTSTGTAVSGGIVQLLTGGEAVASADVGGDGSFGFLLLGGGTFDLQAIADGATFAPVSAVTVQSGQTVQQDFVAGTASLHVTVNNPDAGVAGATVVLVLGAVQVESGKEDASGTITFANLAPGDYQVQVTTTDARGGSGTTTLAAGDTGTVAVSLSQLVTLSGKVSSDTGTAVAQAQVILQSTADPSVVFAAQSGVDGAYTLPNLPAGNYDVVVVADGYDASLHTGLAVSATQTLNATLTASTTQATGRVVDNTGQPVPNASVTVLDAAGHSIGGALSGPDGTFRLSTASGAGLTVRVMAAGFVGRRDVALTWTSGTTNPVGDIAIQAVAVTQNMLLVGGHTALAAFSAGHQLMDLTAGFASPLADVPSWLRAPGPISKSSNNVALSSIPPLPAECADSAGEAYDRLRLAVFRQDVAFSLAQGFYASALSLHETTSLLVAAGFFELAGTIASVSISVVSIAGFGVEALGLQALRTALTANKYRNLAYAIESIRGAIAEIKSDFETCATADSEGDEAASLDALKGAGTAFLNAMGNLLAAFDFTDNVFGLLGGVANIIDINAHCQGLIGDLDRIIDEMHSGLDAWRAASDNYNRAVAQYDDAVAAANRWLVIYQASLANCKERGHDSLPPLFPTNRLPNPYPYDPTVVIPTDPNEILGPTGFGDDHWVTATNSLAYTIRYENAATATAPAQQVVITEQLDPDLDWRTFRVGDFGWGSLRFSVAPGQAFLSQRLDITQDYGFLVDVTAFIDVQTGVATWTFTTLDPATGEPPDNPLLGFLPPTNSDGIGEGFVTYQVSPKSAVASGAVIDAQARVVFDTQGPLDTPAIFNTVDAGPPASSVKPLPAITQSPDFLVSWSGADAGGSAIRDYTIYVATDGGPFTPWLTDTTLTEASYLGEVGHSYAFYSVARDNAGFVEAAPTTADAQTAVTGSLDAGIAGPTQGLVGQELTYRLTLATPSIIDPFAQYTFTVDWGDGSAQSPDMQTITGVSGTTVTHRYDAPSPAAGYAVQATITDAQHPVGQPTLLVPKVQIAALTAANLTSEVAQAPGEPVTLDIAQPADVAALVNAVNALPNPGKATTITLNVPAGDYSAQTFQPPANVTLVVRGAGTVSIHGANGITTHAQVTSHVATAKKPIPAVTVSGGTVVIDHVTLTNDFNTPTILVTGGTLVLRSANVSESTKYNQSAISITGTGSADLGTSGDPGNNTLILHEPGVLIAVANANAVSALGNVFQTTRTVKHKDVTTTFDGFGVEDHVVHAMDKSSLGAVTWTAGTAYVTPHTLGIQQGINLAGAGGTVNVQGSGYRAYHVPGALTLVFQNGPALGRTTDARLVVQGTTGNDQITFKPSDLTGGITVNFNSLPTGTFAGVSSLFALGGAGNDSITLASATIQKRRVAITVPALLDGGDGNDTQSAAGSTAADILIGGAGKDVLTGGAGSDLLIGDRTQVEADLAALASLLATWTSNASYADRIAALLAGGSGTPALGATSILDDQQSDQLTGGSGQDWFIVRSSNPQTKRNDKAKDTAVNETVTGL